MKCGDLVMCGDGREAQVMATSGSDQMVLVRYFDYNLQWLPMSGVRVL